MLIELTFQDKSEMVVAEFFIGKNKLVKGSVYIAPSVPCKDFQELSMKCNVMIYGNLNTIHQSWGNYNCNPKITTLF